MRSAVLEQPSQVDMGFSSMVSLLTDISRAGEKSKSFLGSITDYALGTAATVADTFKMFSAGNVGKNSFWKSMRSANTVRNNLMRGTTNKLEEIRLQLLKNQQTEEIESERQRKFFNFNELLTGFKLLFPKKEKEEQHASFDHESADMQFDAVTTGHFASIDANTKNMVSLLKDLLKSKGVTASKLEKTPEIEEEEEPAHATKGGKGFFNVGNFAKAIATLKVSLTKALIGNISKFEKAFEKLLDLPKDKAKTFNDGMEKFADSMMKMEKKVAPSVKTIGLLALSFVGLSLAVTNPLFALGLGAIGLFVVVMEKYTSGKKIDEGLFKFSMGIAILTVAMGLMRFVDWTSGAKMLVFIAGLGLVMRLYTKPAQTKGMLDFAMGIGLLTISMLIMNFVDWSSGVKMLLFIAGLGLALKTFAGNSANPGQGLKSFGEGLGLITLSLIAFQFVDFGSILKMLLFIGGLGLVLRTFKMDQAGLKSPLLSFAFGLALMVLAVLAFAEIPITAILKTLAFIGILGLELKLFNGTSSMSPIIQFAFGLGLMVLAMYAMQELPWEALAKTLVFIGGLGLVLKLFDGASGADFLMIAGGVLIISAALWVFKKIGWTMKDALILAGTITLLGVVVALAGALAEVLVPGAISLAIMGGSLLLFGLALWGISKMSIDYGKIAEFGVAALALTTVMALIAPLALVGAVGAVLFLPIAASALIGAVSLFLISKLKNFEVKPFASAVWDLTWGFVKIAPLAVIGAVGAALFLPIAAAAILGAVALKAISILKFDPKTIASYGAGMKSLIDAIDSIGVISLTRSAYKAIMLLPVFAAATLGALALKAISEMDLSEPKVLLAGKLINEFTSIMCDTLIANKDKLAKAMPGIVALSRLMGISSDLAKGISSMANMEYVEHTVKNGRLVVKSVRKVTEADIRMVGTNLAVILQALVEPLTILGSDSATFQIGGRKVANPFKNPQALKGIEVLAKIGSAFKPLFDSVSQYAGLGLANDPKKLDMFSKSLTVVMNSIIWALDRAASVKGDLATKAIGTVSRFVSSFKDLNTDRMNGINGAIEKFINNLADDAKWRRIMSNIANLRKEFQGIANSINSIDMAKATMFEKTVRELLGQNSNQQLAVVVEQLREIFGLIVEGKNGGPAKATAADVKADNSFGFGFRNPEPAKPAKRVGGGKVANEEHDELTDMITALNIALNGILAQVTGVNEKLGGKLKVQNVSGTQNQFFPQ